MGGGGGGGPPPAPPPPADDADAGQFWKDFIRDTAPEFRKPTIEQLDSFIKPTWQALIDGAVYCEPQLKEIARRVRPDVVVEDNVVCFPALMTAGGPLIRGTSCNPLEGSGGARPAVFPRVPPGHPAGRGADRRQRAVARPRRR